MGRCRKQAADKQTPLGRVHTHTPAYITTVVPPTTHSSRFEGPSEEVQSSLPRVLMGLHDCDILPAPARLAQGDWTKCRLSDRLTNHCLVICVLPATII